MNGPYEYTGTIVDVGAIQTFGNNGFAKREFLVSYDPDAEYPSFLQITLKRGKQDKTNLVNESYKGARVKVRFFVETRKWTSKTSGKTGYSTEATAIDVINMDKSVEPKGKGRAPAPAEPDNVSYDEVADDMPF